MRDSSQHIDIPAAQLATLSLTPDAVPSFTPHTDSSIPEQNSARLAVSTASTPQNTPYFTQPLSHIPSSISPNSSNHHAPSPPVSSSYFSTDSHLQTHPSPISQPSPTDDDLSRMGFVVGTAPSYLPTASWGAPAVDAVYVHPHMTLSASYLSTPQRSALQYPTAPLPLHRPASKDPWAQSAVWRPSPHPVPQGATEPFVGSRFPTPSSAAPPSISLSSTFPSLQESRPQRRRKPKDSVRDLRSELSRSTTGNTRRVSPDGSTTDVSLSTAGGESTDSKRAASYASNGHSNQRGQHYHNHSGGHSGTNRGGNSGGGSSGRASHNGSNGYLSVREYNRRISAYARRRDLNGALRTLGELDRAPKISRNLFTYNAVINALVMCSQHGKADEFWREMQDTGIEPNLVTFNTMLKSCFGGMDEDVQRAFRLLREMEERGISPDRVTLNSLINACVSAGKVRDAQGVYEEMRRLNIEPDAYTFCTLAKQARHQCDVSMLDALLLHQLHHHTILQGRVESSTTQNEGDKSAQISPVAYNTIADAYIRCGYPTRAIGLLERMRDSKRSSGNGLVSSKDVIPVRPDVQTFNVRLKALRESGAPSADAFAALDDMRYLGLEADHITLLTLADLCCRREEMALAEGVLHAATEADIKEFERGSAEWKTYCGGNQSAKHSEPARTGSGHLNHRQVASKRNMGLGSAGHMTQGYTTSSRRNANQPRNAKANAALFNALIRGYSSLDPPNVDAAVALYMEMRRFVEKYGFAWYAADSVTYTMLVDGFARVGDAARAEVIISEMEAAGRANVVAYNAYLKANRGNGYKAALSVLERMKGVGLRPDVVTYNTVIDFLSAEENGTQIAEELVRVDMPRSGVRPDLLTFNTLIKGVARNRGNKADAGAALGAAYRWLRELQSRGLKPDEFTYQSMVSACAAAGDAPRALEFFRKVETERAKRVKANGRSNGYFGVGGNFGVQTAPRGHVSPALPKPTRAATLGNDSMRIPSTAWASGNQVPDQQGHAMQAHQGANDWMLLPHPAAYIALMRAFLSSSAKDGVESVLQLRDEMVARGLELGRTGYTAVADAYAERGDFDSVEATLSEMVTRCGSQDQKLSPVHHCIRMKSLCNAGRLDEAIGILPEVENADTAVFNVLIFACAKAKDMDRMVMVLRAMESSQIEPDAITSRALSSMMRNVARTLKTFDERFRSNITAFVSEGQGQAES